jgi:hypothetical protein
MIVQLIGNVKNDDYFTGTGCYPCNFCINSTQFAVIREKETKRLRFSAKRFLLCINDSTSTPLHLYFGTPGGVELSLLSSGNDIFVVIVLSDELIRPTLFSILILPDAIYGASKSLIRHKKPRYLVGHFISP